MRDSDIALVGVDYRPRAATIVRHVRLNLCYAVIRHPRFGGSLGNTSGNFRPRRPSIAMSGDSPRWVGGLCGPDACLQEIDSIGRPTVRRYAFRLGNEPTASHSLVGAIRRTTRHVDHWQGRQMALCCTAAALLEPSPALPLLPCARDLGLLKLSLQAHYASLTTRLVNPSG